jgi:hypothetical protein
MEENVFVYEGWRWTEGKGTIFRGVSVPVESEEYKIVNIMVRAFLPNWEVIGIWKNKYNSYLIQLRSSEKISGAPGGEDFYYTFLIITEDGKLASSSYYNLQRLLEESIRERFRC